MHLHYTLCPWSAFQELSTRRKESSTQELLGINHKHTGLPPVEHMSNGHPERREENSVWLMLFRTVLGIKRWTYASKCNTKLEMRMVDRIKQRETWWSPSSKLLKELISPSADKVNKAVFSCQFSFHSNITSVSAITTIGEWQVSLGTGMVALWVLSTYVGTSQNWEAVSMEAITPRMAKQTSGCHLRR